ncbi:MAG: PqqD family protein [Brevundimonas sp.]
MSGDRPTPGPDDVITRGGDLLTAMVDGELLAMSVERGACYGLNRVGARVWELLERARSIRSLCEALEAEFDVSPAACLGEVTELIEGLRAEGLVTVESPR